MLKFHLVGFVYILWDLLAHKFAFHSKGFSVVIIQKAVGSVTKLSSSKCNLFQPHLGGKSLEAIQGEKRAKKKKRKKIMSWNESDQFTLKGSTLTGFRHSLVSFWSDKKKGNGND